MGRPRSTERLHAAATLGGRATSGRRRPPPALSVSLLVPIVRRAVITGRGPAALLLWLHARVGTWPVYRPTEPFILALAADFLRVLGNARGTMPNKPSQGCPVPGDARGAARPAAKPKPPREAEGSRGDDPTR